jgi:hypothetical protein
MSLGFLITDYAFQVFYVLIEQGLLLLLLFFIVRQLRDFLKQPIMLDLDIDALLCDLFVLLNYLQILPAVH